MFNKIFDAKDSKWICLYKNINIFAALITFILCIISGCIDAGSGFIDVIYNDSILDVLFWLVLGAIITTTHLSLTMLLANIATNLHIIREKTTNNN